ncbi:MAG: prolipoprotein diacylglyceryl transferase [Phycisphaerales bacterium]
MTLAEAFVHRLDPWVFQFGPDIGIRWYGLSYVAGFVLGWLLMRWAAARTRSPLGREGATDLLFVAILGVMIGGRLGYALFYRREIITTFTPSFPWWDLFRLNKGGMASHGGMLGVITAAMWFSLRRKVSVRHALDILAFATPVGLGLGRVANFINAELPGRALPETMRANPPGWSIKYPSEVFEFGPDRLVTLAEAMRGEVFTEQLTRTVYDRALAGDAAVLERLTPLLTPRWPSQIFQAVSDGPVLLAILAIFWLKPRRAGTVGALFVLSYGILRIITEQFRQPDEGIALLAGLTRGQVLSTLMVLAGGFLLWRWSRDASSARYTIGRRPVEVAAD